jgi:hypothetical protein
VVKLYRKRLSFILANELQRLVTGGSSGRWRAPYRAFDEQQALLFVVGVRRSALPGSATVMSSKVERPEPHNSVGTASKAAGITDDDTTEIASNAERMPTDAAAVRESAGRAEDIDRRRTSELREAGEPSGTTTTGPASQR